MYVLSLMFIGTFSIVTTHNTTRSFGDRLSNIKVLINVSDKDQWLSLVIACFNLARLKKKILNMNVQAFCKTTS